MKESGTENETYSEEQLRKKVNGAYNRVFKRCIDFLLALILFLVCLPFYLIISIAICIDDGLPVLYRAPRGGYHNRTFRICKFRSMVKNADRIGGYTTAFHDPRVTKVGAVLRKAKLGDVCIIGLKSRKRPQRLAFLDVQSYEKPRKNFLNRFKRAMNDA